MIIKEINERTNILIAELTNLWERSVKTSHHFLNLKEIERIKQYVPNELRKVAKLFVAIEKSNVLLAFIGIKDDMIQMLFVDDKYVGKGIGSKLVDYVINNYDIKYVEVNEDNLIAHKFYLNKGFKDLKRKEYDDYNDPYPIIIMKR